MTKNIDNVLKNIIYTSLFIIPFIVFLVPGSLFFPFITGKAFAFRILVEIMFGAWAVLALRKPEYRPRFSWITALATAFIILIGASDFFGVNPIKSIWSNFERMEGLVLMVHLYAFLIVTGSVLTEKMWTRFLKTSVFASVLMSFYGFMQMAGRLQIHQGTSRLDATLGNSAYLAVYMLLSIFITLFLLLREKKGSFMKWVYGLVIALQTVIIYNTQTRGAILGLIAGMFIAGLFVVVFERENKKMRKICVVSMLGILALVGLFIGFKDSSFVKNSEALNRFASISLQETTTKSRFMVWHMAWEGFKEHPVLGWGQENFNYVFNKYYNPGMYNQEQWFDRTHNVFFDWLIAGGLLGLLGYLSLFGALVYYIIKDERKHFSVVEKGVLLGALVGYFIHNLFVFDNLISYILFFTLLGYLHSLNKNESFEKENELSRINTVAIPVVVLLVAYSVYFFNAQAFLVNSNLLKALMPYQNGISKNIDYFKKSLSYDSYYKAEAREQLVNFAGNVISANVDDQSKQETMSLAYTEMLEQIKSDPNNARYEVILGTFLARTGNLQESAEHLERALELSPNKQTILTLLGRVYTSLGNYEKSLEYFKKAYELDESFTGLRDLYIVGLINSGKSDMVSAVLNGDVGDSDDIIQAYFNVKNYQKVFELLKGRIEKEPNNSQLMLSLAAAYSEAGYKSLAIQELQKLKEVDPSYKDQADYYIGEIRAGRQ